MVREATTFAGEEAQEEDASEEFQDVGEDGGETPRLGQVGFIAMFLRYLYSRTFSQKTANGRLLSKFTQKLNALNLTPDSPIYTSTTKVLRNKGILPLLSLVDIDEGRSAIENFIRLNSITRSGRTIMPLSRLRDGFITISEEALLAPVAQAGFDGVYRKETAISALTDIAALFGG
ncbi:hypothetical protein BX616_002427 [Lobosporangium transversale]|nr:hypothetical protein BX616_002427 [Lobosporangium transversale]